MLAFVIWMLGQATLARHHYFNQFGIDPALSCYRNMFFGDEVRGWQKQCESCMPLGQRSWQVGNMHAVGALDLWRACLSLPQQHIQHRSYPSLTCSHHNPCS